MSHGMIPVTDEVEEVMLCLERNGTAEYLPRLGIWRLSDKHIFEEEAKDKNPPKPKPNGDAMAQAWREKYPAGSTSSATPVSR